MNAGGGGREPCADAGAANVTDNESSSSDRNIDSTLIKTGKGN
jgi:hypothetical protein